MPTLIKKSNPDPALQPLILQLVAWVDARSRTYGEAMDAWRTSCPRLSVWEDTLEAGLIQVAPVPGGGLADGAVRVTAKGAALIRAEAAR
jgi:hypothetical protein